ncbi:hypothetical protein DU506_03095 [Vreelandella rituensis]|uniref:Uncharacterized protein n=1 Tax=Vreelandella rituensis TaxID=2282306 RepID=A0A368U807_9GAMM|nr:hypothetical protein DU506_03095 [Halomonas rituensis]
MSVFKNVLLIVLLVVCGMLAIQAKFDIVLATGVVSNISYDRQSLEKIQLGGNAQQYQKP